MHLTQLKAVVRTIEQMYPQYTDEDRCVLIGRMMYRILEDGNAKSSNIPSMIFCISRGICDMTYEDVRKMYVENIVRG